MATQRVQLAVSFEYQRSGVLVPAPTGTPVSVIDRVTSNPVTVFAGLTGASTIAAVVTDSGGNVPGYVPQGSYRLTAAPQANAVPPFPGVTINFEAVRGDGVENYAPGSVTAAALAPGIFSGGSIIPTGVVLDFAGPTAPTGFVMCDGTQYTTTGPTQALFQLLGYTYGGSGGFFLVPDCRGRGTVGAGTGAGLTNRALGSKFGEENHTLVTSELASHAHGVIDPTHAHGINDPTHDHGVNDPGHAHGGGTFGWSLGSYQASVTDSPARFGQPIISAGVAGGTADTVPRSQPAGDNRWGGSDMNHSHAIATDARGTGIGIFGNRTGIGIFGSSTGITLGNAGSSGGHNNMAPSFALNKIIKL